MIQTTFIISALLALILILIGNYYKDRDFGIGLAMAGFILLIIMGLNLVSNDLQVTSGETVTETFSYGANNTLLSSNKTVSPIYTPAGDIEGNSYSWVFNLTILLIGLFGLGAAVSYLFDKRQERDPDERDEADDF